MLWRRLTPIFACALACCALAAPAAVALKAQVPGNFVGVVAGPPLVPTAVSPGTLAQQLTSMARSGVQSVRFALYWGAIQPYATTNDVPADQRSQYSSDGVVRVPTNWAPLDAIVGDAAGRGLSLLPSVLAAPVWDGKGPSGANTLIPQRAGLYANFLRALILRYGPHGTFWRTHHPKYAIRSWQIWNEPNETSLWPTQPFAKDYVALLRSAHTAIKRADPSAKVVLAGFPSAPGFTSWDYLNQVYAVKGARGQFDVAAVHPYTKQPAGVITIIQKMRQLDEPARRCPQAAARRRDGMAVVGGQDERPVRLRDDRGGTGPEHRRRASADGRRAQAARSERVLPVHVDRPGAEGRVHVSTSRGCPGYTG